MDGQHLSPGSLCIYEPRTKDGRSYYSRRSVGLPSPELALVISIAPDGQRLVMLKRGDGNRFRWVPPYCTWPLAMSTHVRPL